MDKMKLAHDAALAMINSGCSLHTAIADAWAYADEMQAEADKRNKKERPKALFEVDWSQAPKEYQTTGWYIFKGVAHWIADEIPCGPAPSFGFTGTHIVERPHGF